MKYPVIGIESITGFTDSIIGETTDRTVKREFRYTLDAVNYTEWIPLTVDNVTNIPIQSNYYFQSEFRYTRTGTDNTDLITFNWVRLDYTTTVECKSTHYFDVSIYKYFFDCFSHEKIKGWCVSVLKKLYHPGILPNLMTRGSSRNRNQEDRDFIDFWSTISCFFSLIVNHARAFSNIYDDKRLLKRYLQQQDITIQNNQELTQLQYLTRNLYREVSHRGSINIFKKSTTTPNGEFLRLIQYDDRVDEFIFESAYYIWNLDVHSPIYKGIHPEQAFKAYSRNIDLSKYPLINSDKISIQLEGDEEVIKIQGVLDETKAGIGFVDPSNLTESEISKLFNIDPRLSYELSFMVRGNARFTVKGYGYSSALTTTHPTSISPIGYGNSAITQQKVVDNGEWYWVRVILHSFDQLATNDPEIKDTSLGVGNNLRIPRIMCKAGFEITIDRTGMINQEPTVSNVEVSIEAGQSKIITYADISADFQDIEGNNYNAIRIDDVTVSETGNLYHNGVAVSVFPHNVSIEDIINEKLVYIDNSPDVSNFDIDITFTPLDDYPGISSDEDFLLIKNINFKLLKRDYDIGVVNGIPLIETWMIDRSGKSKSDTDTFIKNTLIPYNILNYNNLINE
jgi:hypothetical protein